MRTSFFLNDVKRGQGGLSNEPAYGFFDVARYVADRHPLVTDGGLAAVLVVASTGWLFGSPYLGPGAAVIQAALVAPLVWRRMQPTVVFFVVAALALVEWLVGTPLIASGAVLVALYTVAVHEPRSLVMGATAVAEFGSVLAAVRWQVAGTVPRSLLFLTATVIAALCAGLTVRSGSAYLGWLAERARRLEIERDQQASIATAAERTRIAREMHDIVAHSLSVLITLVDAATLVSRSDPDRAESAMRHASEVGRQALGDMRSVIGVLRTEPEVAELLPQPGLEQLNELVDRVRATGLQVEVAVEGTEFPLGSTAQLTVYRIVQESLTNTMKHAVATKASVTIRYGHPSVVVEVADDGAGQTACRDEYGPEQGSDTDHSASHGHGIAGMRERAIMHRGGIEVGPRPGGGWKVVATLRPDAAMAAS